MRHERGLLTVPVPSFSKVNRQEASTPPPGPWVCVPAEQGKHLFLDIVRVSDHRLSGGLSRSKEGNCNGF